jgi:hypothetical protein
MKHVLASLAIGACLLLPSAGVVLSAGKTLQTPPSMAKQPGTTAGFNCGTSTAPMEPGNAANATGSAFNEPFPVGTGSGGVAGGVYAGNTGTASAANANSTAAVAQYDTACRALSGQPP